MVKELVADTMTVEQIWRELERILYDDDYRNRMQEGYELVARRLGQPGAPQVAARQMVELLSCV